MAYDELLKSRLVSPLHYDRMIKLITDYNPAANGDRAWSEQVINDCIGGVLSGSDDTWATGCCVAYRRGDGQVELYLDPLIPVPGEKLGEVMADENRWCVVVGQPTAMHLANKTYRPIMSNVGLVVVDSECKTREEARIMSREFAKNNPYWHFKPKKL